MVTTKKSQIVLDRKRKTGAVSNNIGQGSAGSWPATMTSNSSQSSVLSAINLYDPPHFLSSDKAIVQKVGFFILMPSKSPEFLPAAA